MEEPGIEISETELELVRDILKTLAKTIKTFNVYPKGNPIYQKFVTDLFEKFSVFFESADELPLDVRQYSLVYKEKEVFSSEEKTENIAMLLFADGIRQLCFHKGISHGELTDFIEILRAALKSKADDDDDIVTLLWERNIRNMGYTAVEDTVDDDLAVEEGLMDIERTDQVGEETTIGAGSFEWRPETASTQIEAEPLSKEELGSIENEISENGEGVLLEAAAGLFFELVKNEPEIESFPEIVMSIGKILDIELERKEIPAALGILKELKEIAGLCGEPERLALIEQIKARAGELENLRTLIESSAKGEIEEYLFLLGRSALRGMIALLGELEDRRQRRLLCEVLAGSGKNDIEVLAEALDDSRWYLVRNIVLILGMTKEPSAVRHLEKTIRHADVRVRRETARALESIRTDETKKFFVPMLSDPDITVRLISLKALRRFRDPALFERLKTASTRDELKKRAFAEKRELLETLGALGGEEAFPLLSDLMKKSWLIEKDDVTEIRAAAAYGLAQIGTADSIALLEKETASKKSLLKEACIKSLKELQLRGNVRK